MKVFPRFPAVCAAVIFCLAVMSGAAFALSDAEYKKMLASSPEFADADKRLNDAWSALRKAVSGERMERYRKFQRQWASSERDALIDAMSDEGYRDRIPEAALEDGEALRPLAYALVTNERAVILEELARQENDDGYIPSFHGIIESARDDAGELFWFTPDGWWTSLVFCYADRDIPMAGAARDILTAFGEQCGVTVSGRLNGGDGFDYRENGLTLLIAPD